VITGGVRAATIVLALGWVGALHAAVRSSSQEPGAPALLSQTGLYEASRPGAIARGVRQFSPQYPLWTDGAKKARWIYLPPGTSIDTTIPGDWTYPVGTRFWKEFSFNGRKVETRFIWRASDNEWIFASYAWNEEQTDAVLAPAEGIPGVVEVAPGRRHGLPAISDCRACHRTSRPGPLGFNALQLSTDRDPNAIHGEPLAAGMITLSTLSDEGGSRRRVRSWSHSRRGSRPAAGRREPCSATSPPTAAPATTGAAKRRSMGPR